ADGDLVRRLVVVAPEADDPAEDRDAIERGDGAVAGVVAEEAGVSERAGLCDFDRIAGDQDVDRIGGREAAGVYAPGDAERCSLQREDVLDVDGAIAVG